MFDTVALVLVILQNGHYGVGAVVIKIDTGMSRNGCQPEELPEIIQVDLLLHI